MSRKSRFISCVAITLALVGGAVSNSGCAASGAVVPGQNQAGSQRLQLVTPDRISLSTGQEMQIKVKYLRADRAGAAEAPVTNQLIQFATIGEARGSTLSGAQGVTAADGIATITVRGGDAGTFSVQATVAGTSLTASTNVVVGGVGLGTLTVVPDYTGARRVANAELYLFANADCALLSRRLPRPAQSATVALRAMHNFTGVQTGAPLAIFAASTDANGFVAADACVDTRLDAATATVRVQLRDLAPQAGGPWDFEDELDVTRGFPTEVDLALDVFGALGSDHPGRDFLLFVSRIPGLPSALMSTLGNSFVASAAGSFLDQYIVQLRSIDIPGLPPNFLAKLFNLGADLNRAMSRLRLVSTVTLAEPTELNTVTGTRRAQKIKVMTDTGLKERLIRGASVSVTGTLQNGRLALAEHTLAVNFGETVRTVLDEVLIPELYDEFIMDPVGADGGPITCTMPAQCLVGGRQGNCTSGVCMFPSPRTIGGVLNDVVDCNRVAAALGGSLPSLPVIGAASADLVTSACRAGLEFGGAFIEGQIASRLAFTNLSLTENVVMVDSDLDYDLDKIDANLSTVNASWSGTLGRLPETGTFSGVVSGGRQSDTRGRAHPIRDQLQALR